MRHVNIQPCFIICILADEKTKSKDRPLRPKGQNIDVINPETYEWISAEANLAGKSVRREANDLLDMLAERKDFLAQVFPDLKKIGFTDDHLYINDDKLEGVAKIGLDEKGYVHCQLCKKTDCIHALYSMAMIEVTRLAPLRKAK